MVQRKVPKKPSIQAADHVKSEKLLANPKPSSFQQKEIKNKGGIDLKKKMKKSRSFKNMKGAIVRPGKPPPIVLPEKHLATPMKPSPVKKAVMDTTPNYMKSTTSSDARKETCFQVSSKSPRAFSADGKYSIRRKPLNSNTKGCSDPGSRGVRTLSRISSLKLVRTLTKTPSFKQTRISGRKCSSMILSENLNVQRATCSSTIKDHKFPDYLTLNVGATETEGTSIMKVCPFTYCSLNGHHHGTLLPLKSFLSSRRRMLKAQRSIKIGCLSPRRPKPVRETVNEIQAEQRGPHRQPPPLEADSMIQEMDSGFIEIYSQQREDPSQMNQPTANEDLPEENQNHGVGEKLYPPNLDQDKTELEFLNCLYESEEHSTTTTQSEEEYSEKYYMEWEAGEVHCGGSYPGGAKPIQTIDMINLENANSSLDSSSLDEAVFTIDAVVGKDGKESLPDEILQEPIYSDSEAGSSAEDDSEYTSSHQNMWSSNGMKCEDQSHIMVEVVEASPSREDGENEESDYHHEDGTVSANSAFLEKAVEETSVTIIEKGASEPDDLSRMELETTIVHNSQQVISPVIEDSHDAGISVFEYQHDISENLTQKLSNSIGTQTEKGCEVQQDMNGNMMDDVNKRSIGIQTEFEDHDQPGALIESPYYENAQLDGSLVVTESKDSQAGISFQMEQFTNECTNRNQAVSEDINNQLCSIFNDDNSKQTELGVCLSDNSSAIQSISKSESLNNSEETESAECAIHKVKMGIIKSTGESSAHEEITNTCKTKEVTSRVIEGNNGLTEFNPRAPNFLPAEPDPEAEKVDLRHLALDEKKNAEDWMVDHAIQQAVTKLAQARKRKVALLVEAFETVSPSPKREYRLRHSSIASPQARTILACS